MSTSLRLDAGNSKVKSVSSLRATTAKSPLVISGLVVLFAVAWFAAARFSMLMAGVDRSQTALTSAERVLAADRRGSGFGLEGRGFRVAVVDLVQAAHEKCVGAGDAEGEDVFKRHAGGFGK